MKAILIFAEYLFGFVVLLITLVTILIGCVIGLVEVPRYLRIKSM